MNIENRTSTVCATAALGHAQRGRPVARAREAKAGSPEIPACLIQKSGHRCLREDHDVGVWSSRWRVRISTKSDLAKANTLLSVLQRRKGPCDVVVDADRLGSDAFSLWDCAAIMMKGVFDSCPGADRARNRIRSSAPWLRSKVEIDTSKTATCGRTQFSCESSRAPAAIPAHGAAAAAVRSAS